MAYIRLNSNTPSERKKKMSSTINKNGLILKQTACAEGKSRSVTSSRQERELSVKLKKPVNLLRISILVG